MGGKHERRSWDGRRKAQRGCGSIGLAGVTDISPLEAIAGEYEMPEIDSFAQRMMSAAEELIAAGSLDAGNGAALDARIDMELEKTCARFARQHAENSVMLDRISAALSARLRELEVRDKDVAQRLEGARAGARQLHGEAEPARSGGSDGVHPARRAVVSIAPRNDDKAGFDMKEAVNA